MPGSFLSEVERDRLIRFPSLIPDEDLIAFFTLSNSDKAEVKKQRGDHNRFGFALQICTIRYLGFLPQDFSSPPIEAVLLVGEQLHLQVECLADYGRRFQTRQDHLKSVLSYLRFRRAKPNDWKKLRAWLPVSVKTRKARPLPKYFGYGKGLAFYTWTSDQLSQYGIKVIAPTKDAAYVLDEILDNETELDILEHTAETPSYFK